MSAPNPSPSCRRVHIVLVPGFGGFDALGQLEYYAGITPLLQSMKALDTVLHYFDNFPTAAVITRAARLRSYLAKRLARGEISNSDEIALVGHSTGGLDIRCLLSDLQDRKPPVIVDGGAQIDSSQILDLVRRVVFLSVPHWGTNIADWVRDHGVWREAAVAELRAAVAGSQVPPVNRIEDVITGMAASLTGAGLLRAIQDCLTESDEYYGNPGPDRTAEAQEAASQLALYLRHMASNFRAIDDLTSHPSARSASPAHFSLKKRRQENEMWKDRRIQTLSYITLGKRPFRFDPKRPAPPLQLAKPWTYPEVTKDRALSSGTDMFYRAGYRACAGGPFTHPALTATIRRQLNGTPAGEIALWDNDGIVNTLSMLWPEGDNVLVRADHMDIVGHYIPVRAIPGGGRAYRAYDLLKSGSGFDGRIFRQVWTEIFTFCAGRKLSQRAGSAPSAA
jgi:triacylglycerol lipase